MWIEAIKAELGGLSAKHTFENVDQVPFGFNAIGSRLVFTIKWNLNGTVLKYKVRLVAQGFSQRPGLDYTDTYSPVVHITSVRLVGAISTKLNLTMHQLDIDSTFLCSVQIWQTMSATRWRAACVAHIYVCCLASFYYDLAHMQPLAGH